MQVLGTFWVLMLGESDLCSFKHGSECAVLGILRRSDLMGHTSRVESGVPLRDMEAIMLPGTSLPPPPEPGSIEAPRWGTATAMVRSRPIRPYRV